MAEAPPKLDPAALAHRVAALAGWSVEGEHLVRAFSFPDFAQALAFVNRVGAEAEAQWHHPDLTLGWGRVAVSLTTHEVGGVTERDFRLAEAIDALARPAFEG